MTRRGTVFLSFFAALGMLPLSAEAQQTGTVTGRVTNAGGSPLGGARVQIVGTTLGTMSGTDGTYRIPGVAAGTQQVRALRLGYASQAVSVLVPAGGSVEANLTLAEAATKLDEVVVTATGEAGTWEPQPTSIEDPISAAGAAARGRERRIFILQSMKTV